MEIHFEESWKRVVEKLRNSTPEERRYWFVRAGILTETGEVAEPYEDLIKKKLNPEYRDK